MTQTPRMQVNKRGAVIHAEVWDTVHPKQFLVCAALAVRLLLWCWRSCMRGGCGRCALPSATSGIS